MQNGLTNGHTNGYTNGSHPAPRPFEGKVALVTGGGRGLGAGIALELAARGASVAINYSKSSAAANELVSTLQNQHHTHAIAIQANVSNTPEVTRLFAQTLSHFGRLDIVVSNAGMESFIDEESVTEEDFDQVFDLNCRAQYFVGQHGLKHLSHGGRIILTSSIAATMPGVKNHALYAGSKAAVEGFTRSFAADGGSKKITVNAIAPGGIMTDMFAANSWHYAPKGTPDMSVEVTAKGLASVNPLGRVGVPKDVGRLVSWLASEESEWVNGQVIQINGGGR
ncbi:MAG: hypothetical protein LQ351_005322 [Letrouitia transgressa]|nr:MAG: hypothetical protein LQ351_005322 [Letrouitia transgressa]